MIRLYVSREASLSGPMTVELEDHGGKRVDVGFMGNHRFFAEGGWWYTKNWSFSSVVPDEWKPYVSHFSLSDSVSVVRELGEYSDQNKYGEAWAVIVPGASGVCRIEIQGPVLDDIKLLYDDIIRGEAHPSDPYNVETGGQTWAELVEEVAELRKLAETRKFAAGLEQENRIKAERAHEETKTSLKAARSEIMVYGDAIREITPHAESNWPWGDWPWGAKANIRGILEILDSSLPK